jgi:aspartyl-tRNA(Asn)/glutamyl-tRNA(Gln) amidotransferase subunit A
MSAAELTEQCLRRIDAENSRLNAFILVMKEAARQQARNADKELSEGNDRGPLHGVPISIKDLIDIQGTATTAASLVRQGHVADADASAIKSLRDAGAVLIGKTNLHEFAFGTTNEESAFGPARNPHDLSRSPGGSSGGSAASIVAGMALASLGTDTGGSIRIPAAACGIVGLKPGFGEVPTDGVVPLSPTLDHVGPLSASVEDAWSLYSALMRSPNRPIPEPRPIEKIRLALLKQYFCDMMDDEVRTAFDGAVDTLRRTGVCVTETSVPRASLTGPVYMHISFSEAAAYHGPTLERMPERYTKPVRLRLETARYVMAEDYVRALVGKQQLQREVDVALAENDVLVLPTMPIPAPEIGASTTKIGSSLEPIRPLMLRLTQLFNVTGHPAISLPCGTTSTGLPCGLQLVGHRSQTDRLIAVACSIERAINSR